MREWLANSWKTTLCGILIGLLSAYEASSGQGVDHIPFDPLSHLLMASGLVFAKDAQLPTIAMLIKVGRNGGA